MSKPVDRTWYPSPCPPYQPCPKKHIARSDLGKNILFHEGVSYYQMTEASAKHLKILVFLGVTKTVTYKDLCLGSNDFTTNVELFDLLSTVQINDSLLAAQVVNYKTLHDVPEDLRQLIFAQVNPTFEKVWKGA